MATLSCCDTNASNTSRTDTMVPTMIGIIPIIYQSHTSNSDILKQVGFLWNRTVIIVVHKLPSTSVDFIRSERELEKLHL